MAGHASKGNDIIRYELCEEAIHLAGMIIANPSIQHKENVHALLALMFLNASRFKPRQDVAGNLLTLEEQDRFCSSGPKAVIAPNMTAREHRQHLDKVGEYIRYSKMRRR